MSSTSSLGSFAIVTDSLCDLPADYLANKGVFLVAHHVRLGDTDYGDLAQIDPVDFYIELASTDAQPRPSQPSPAEFQAAYIEAYKQGYTKIISVHASSMFSGSYHAALTAAREVAHDRDVEVHVFDTFTISAAEGFVVEDLVASRDAGASFTDAIAHARLVAAAAKIAVIPAQGTLISKNKKSEPRFISAVRRFAHSFNTGYEMYSFDDAGQLRRSTSSSRISVLGGEIAREMSIASHSAGAIAYVEICGGMPRTLSDFDKPLDTNEFTKQRLRITNFSCALISRLGLGAVGVAYIPAALLGITVAEPLE